MTNKIFQKNKPVHWRSSTLAINHFRIKKHKGRITQAVYNDSGEFPILTLKIQRQKDNLERTIGFSEVSYDDFKLDERREGLPKAIQDIYDDFKVDAYSQLAGREVVGLYILEGLVGIKRV
jgi:hypothetical protein